MVEWFYQDINKVRMKKMQRYDGPAFYRQQNKKKETPTIHRKTQNEERKLYSENYSGPAYKRKNKPDNRHLFHEYTTRTFHPTYVPPSRGGFKPDESRQKYNLLSREIKKTSEDFLLFDDADNSEIPLVDVMHYVPGQNKAGKEELTSSDQEKSSTGVDDSPHQEDVGDETDTPVAQDSAEVPVQASTVGAKLEEKFLPTEVFYPQGWNSRPETGESVAPQSSEGETGTESEFSDQDPESVLAADSISDETENTDQPSESSQAGFSAGEENDSTAEKDDEEFASRVASDEDKESETDLEEAKKDKEPRALEQSLADIMNSEKNDQRNLALFDEEKRQKQIHPAASQDDKEAASQENVDDAAYKFPPLNLLPAPVKNDSSEMDDWVLKQIDVLNEALKSFHVDASVKDWTVGPTVTQFEVTLGRGVKVSKITNLNDDLKLALAAKDIRIEAPIPGKSSVGIEIPNLKSRPVMLSEVLYSDKFKEAKSPLTVALGVDLFGQPQITDLKKMPHGLIAGATGSGKSVFINSLLVSLLYKALPSEVKLLLIDPKAVEMAPYQGIPHLLAPVISDPQAAAAALKWVVDEMEERYQKLAAAGARNIEAFNKKAEARHEYGLKMPYIVIVIDELADLMMVASSEVQDYIARITQKARAAGIHLLIATQRPSVDVITGTIKNNIPTRVAFMVSSQVDSRTIIDTAGAERLLGRGDMLYLGNGAGQPIRLQGTYIEDEVDDVTDFVRQQGRPHYAFDPSDLKKAEIRNDSEDDLMPQVLDYIVNEDSISTSKLQRVFSIGYNRAANIIDDLERQGMISGAKGSKPRDVFLTPEKLAAMKTNR